MLEKRYLIILCVLGVLGLALFLNTYDDSRPEGSLDIRLNKTQAIEKTDAFLRENGFDPSGYSKAVTLNFWDQFYLKKTLGMKETNRLTRSGDVPMWGWQVRYFKELEKEEFRVSANPTTGQIVYFKHEVMDDAKAADISHDQALQLAQKTVQEVHGESEYALVKDSTQKLKNRTEHIFEWEDRQLHLAEATMRIYVLVSGDKVGHYSRYVKVPEDFYRNYIQKEIPSRVVYFIFGVLDIFLLVALLVCLFIQYKYSQIRWKFAWVIVGASILAAFLTLVNGLPLTWAYYNTILSKNMYISTEVVSKVVGALFSGLGFLILLSVGDSLSRDIGREPFPILQLLKERRWNSPEFIERLVLGYSLGLVRLGYVTLFYYVAVQFVPAWKSLPGSYSYCYGGVILPYLVPFSVYFFSTLQEVVKYQLFTVSLFKKYFKITWVAVILSALFWVFANYKPAIYPMYLKALELVPLGIVWAYVYLKRGVEVVVWAEFVFSVILMAAPLLRSSEPFFHTSGIIMLVILTLPALLLFLPKTYENTATIPGGDR